MSGKLRCRPKLAPHPQNPKEYNQGHQSSFGTLIFRASNITHLPAVVSSVHPPLLLSPVHQRKVAHFLLCTPPPPPNPARPPTKNQLMPTFGITQPPFPPPTHIITTPLGCTSFFLVPKQTTTGLEAQRLAKPRGTRQTWGTCLTTLR